MKTGWIKCFFLVLVPVLSCAAQGPFIKERCATISFDPGKSPRADGWREKIYNAPNRWEQAGRGDGNILCAVSVNSASMLYKKVDYDPRECPLAQWRWKVTKLPAKGPKTTAANDDYGARIYFIFPGWTSLTSYVIQYVWDNETPEGTVKTSPSSGRCKQIVVDSGTAGLDRWVTVRRNLFDDYKRAFGRAPGRRVGAVGFMTDSDDTRSSAEACYGELVIGR